MHINYCCTNPAAPFARLQHCVNNTTIISLLYCAASNERDNFEITREYSPTANGYECRYSGRIIGTTENIRILPADAKKLYSEMIVDLKLTDQTPEEIRASCIPR